MIDSHSPFLATIRDRPEDDGPRLVYSDWLEEIVGDSYNAEFIRRQCNFQGMHDEDHETDLFRAHGQAWFGDAVGGKVGVPCKTCNWHSPSCRDCHGSGRVVQWPLTVQVPCERCNDRGESQNPNFRCSLCGGTVTTLTIARGFLDVLTCPTMEAFVGAECERCRGSGEVRNNQMDIYDDTETEDECPDCHGSGHTGGLAAKVFAIAPITAVTIADRHPCQLAPMLTPYGWSHTTGDLSENAFDLPPMIWDQLEGGSQMDGAMNWKQYPAAELANLSLSQACVKWGRKGVW